MVLKLVLKDILIADIIFRLIKKYKYPVYLFIITLLCYWPYTFFQNSLLCDDLDVALPVKYFAGECYQHGFLPLWNPYQIWGFPAHADLQYTNWNIETLLVGTFFGYNYIVLHVLFIFYLFVSGLGMYKLSSYLSQNEKHGFFVGVVYLLSGIIVGHAQSLVTILGMMWLPFMLLYFLKWIREPNLKYTIILLIVSYLFLTMGYQAFAFMILPLFVVLYLGQFYRHYKISGWSKIKNRLIWTVFLFIGIVVLLSPVLITQLQSKPYISRLNGMPLNEVMSNPFPPRALISLINPLLTLEQNEVFDTDRAMRNLHVGLIPLLLIFVSFFKKNKSFLEVVLLIFSLIFLLASFGNVLPVREWMYDVLPGFKLFRFPALLRIVVLICLFSYWAINFDRVFDLILKYKKKAWILLFALFVLIVSVLIYSYLNVSEFTFFKHADLTFNKRVVSSSFFEMAFYFSLIQLLLLVLLYFFILKLKSAKLSTGLLCLTIIELFSSIMLYGQHTTFADYTPSVIQSNFDKMPKGFPFPSTDRIDDSQDKYNYLSGLWLNTGVFKKQLSIGDEWTSYYYSNFDKIVNDLPEIKKELISYPFIYFSKPTEKEMEITLPIDTSRSFIESTVHHQNSSADIQYQDYSPNKIQLKCEAKEEVILNLQQTYHHGWDITIDGQKVNPLWNAGLLMSLRLTKGIHEICFAFKNEWFEKTLWMSYSFLVFLILLFISLYIPSLSQKIIFSGLVIFIVISFIIKLKVKDIHHERNFNQLRSTSSKAVRKFDFNNKQDIRECLELINQKTYVYEWHNYYHAPELIHWMASDDKNEKWKELNGTDTIKRHLRNIINKQTFENIEKSNPQLDTVSIKGVCCFKLNQDGPYTPVVVLLGDKFKASLFGSVKMKCDKKASPVVACEVKHSNGQVETMYFPLNKYLIYDHTWQDVPFSFIFNNELNSEDEIKVFVMNGSKNSCLISEVAFDQ